VAIVLLLAYGTIVHAQSPLTVQPSTNRVGVNTTSPGYTLDVNGTVNATSLRGDGSQLTNVAGGALNKTATDVTVTNTTTETTIFSSTVPANSLGTANRLRLTIHGDHRSDNCEDSCSYLVRLKYGGTTVAAYNFAASPGITAPTRFEFLLSADGATNSQLGLMSLVGGSVVLAQGTAAVSSTVDQPIAVTVAWSVVGCCGQVSTLTMKHAVLEVVK
jgi:hypothetical protein